MEQLQYEKALQDYNLSINELPEDAQIGIESIKDVLKGVKMIEGRGREVNPKTIKKLMSLDKWVYYEILDYVNDTDNNDDEAPVDEKEIVQEVKEQVAEAKESDAETKIGLKINEELANLIKQGITTIEFKALKSQAPTAYKVVFENYDSDGDNGIDTTHYSLIETDIEIFTLKQK